MLTQHFQATISPGPNKLTLLPEETFLLLRQLHTCLFFCKSPPQSNPLCSCTYAYTSTHTHHTHWFQYLEAQARNRWSTRQNQVCSNTKLCKCRKSCFPPSHKLQRGQFRQAETVVELHAETTSKYQPISTALANALDILYQVFEIN